MSAVKSTPENLKPAPRQKRGRPFKNQISRERPVSDAIAGAETRSDLPVALQQPPIISFRAFKVIVSFFHANNAFPQKIDRGAWVKKLYGSNRGKTLDAFRFLGLVDQSAAPTPEMETLVRAYDTLAWPSALREMLERSYQPLLASNLSTLTAGGLLRAIRAIYRTESENTRKSCNFFIQAAREAAMGTGPFLTATSNANWDVGNSTAKKANLPHCTSLTGDGESSNEIIKILAGKLPTYDPCWPDEAKRLWLGSFLELTQRLRN